MGHMLFMYTHRHRNVFALGHLYTQPCPLVDGHLNQYYKYYFPSLSHNHKWRLSWTSSPGLRAEDSLWPTLWKQ